MSSFLKILIALVFSLCIYPTISLAEEHPQSDDVKIVTERFQRWICTRPNGVVDKITIYGEGSVNSFESGDSVIPTTKTAFTCCPDNWGHLQGRPETKRIRDFVNIDLNEKFFENQKEDSENWGGSLYLKDDGNYEAGTLSLSKYKMEKSFWVPDQLFMNVKKKIVSKCTRGEDEIKEIFVKVKRPPPSFVETTIASLIISDFPKNRILSYKFTLTDTYLKSNHCDLFEDNDEEYKKVMGCFVPQDEQILPVFVCRDNYSKISSPGYISKNNLILSLNKGLEWAKINKSVRVNMLKNIPHSNLMIDFYGSETGFSLIDILGCGIDINDIPDLIMQIENQYESAFQKSTNTDLDKLFN
jgi:hypothetical protein